jgi:hypothetical protein
MNAKAKGTDTMPAKRPTAAVAAKKPAAKKPAAKQTAAKKPAAKKPAAKKPAAETVPASETAGAPAAITHEMIAERAYHIWIAGGRPHGRDAEIWQLAEEELRQARKGR